MICCAFCDKSLIFPVENIIIILLYKERMEAVIVPKKLKYRKYYGKNYYRKIWIFLTAFVFGLQLPFSFLLYWYSSQQILLNIDSSNRTVLSQLKSTVDYFSTMTSNVCMQVFMDNETQQAMYSRTTDYNEVRRHMQNLNDSLISTYSSIDSIDVYNAQTKQYFSTKMTNFFLPNDLSEFVKNQKEIPRLQPMLREMKQSINGNEVSEYVFSYFMYDYEEPSSGNESFVVVNEDAGWFMENIRTYSGTDGNYSSIYLTSLSGEIYGSADFPPTSTHQFLARDYWENRNRNEADSPEILIYQKEYEGKRYIVSAISLQNPNNSILLIQDYDYIFRDVTELKNNMIIIGIGFGVLSLVMMVLVARKLYFPVRKFVSYVSGCWGEKGKLDAYKDEFAYLQDTYRSAYQKNELLGKQNRKNEPIVFQYELSKLVLDSCLGRLESFKKNNPDHWLQQGKPVGVVLFKIENMTGNRFFAKTDIQLMTYATENIIQETAEAKYKYSAFYLSTDILCVILGETEDHFVPDKLFRMLQECQHLIYQHLELTLTISHSRFDSDLLQLSSLLKEAREYLQYQYLFGSGKILNIDVCRLNLSNTQSHYSYELDQQIKNALHQKNLNQCLILVDEIIALLSTYQYRSAVTCLMSLLTQITMEFNEMVQAGLLSSSKNFNIVFQNVSKAQTLKDAAFSIKEYINAVLDVEEDTNKNNEDNLASAVIAYVQSHYNDVNMSSQMIADSIGVSSQYMMHKFKQVTGITLNEYIVNLRMSKAAILLQNTDYTVNQIIQEVGIENSTYFYKLFKKVYQCTPREFSKRRIE